MYLREPSPLVTEQFSVSLPQGAAVKIQNRKLRDRVMIDDRDRVMIE